VSEPSTRIGLSSRRNLNCLEEVFSRHQVDFLVSIFYRILLSTLSKEIGRYEKDRDGFFNDLRRRRMTTADFQLKEGPYPLHPKL